MISFAFYYRIVNPFFRQYNNLSEYKQIKFY